MAITGSASVVIDAPIETVYAIAADAGGAPRWQTEIKRTEVLETDAAGQQTKVLMVTDIKVKTIDVVMRFAYDEPRGLTWTQESGPLKSVDGRWEFEDLGDGRTNATCAMTVDLGRALGLIVRGPVVGAVRHQLVETMPEKLKRFVESQPAAA